MAISLGTNEIHFPYMFKLRRTYFRDMWKHKNTQNIKYFPDRLSSDLLNSKYRVSDNYSGKGCHKNQGFLEKHWKFPHFPPAAFVNLGYWKAQLKKTIQ